MSANILFHSAWRKSSHSGADSGCIEIRKALQGFVAIRDSKDTVGPQLTFATEEWKGFIIRVKGNGFKPNRPEPLRLRGGSILHQAVSSGTDRKPAIRHLR